MQAIEIILTILGILVLALIAVYAFFPRSLYGFLRNALRRKGKLKEKSVKVGDLAWPYLEGGPADGEPLVLLHGFSMRWVLRNAILAATAWADLSRCGSRWTIPNACSR